MEYKDIATNVDEATRKEQLKFAHQYMDFIGKNKIEYECVNSIIELAKLKGYKEYIPGMRSVPLKGYINNRDKSCILFTIANSNPEFNLIVSHLDSPRLDLKPNPLYEDNGIGLLKTCFYGGLKQYQWVTIPLEMRGIMYLQDGTKVNISEQFKDKTFMISDILPHLSQEQDKRKTSEAVKGEELNILIGSYKIGDEDEKEKVLKNIKKILFDTCKITEKDFLSADIEFVPKFDPTLIGFDESLIGAYGQDDKVCAYTSLMAELNGKKSMSSFILFADKEEIGSDCTTGMKSNWWYDYFLDLCQDLGYNYREVCRKSLCISADVNGAFDPSWPEPFEPRNACFINKGVAVSKCTGSGGKYYANDSTAKIFNLVMRELDANNINYQASLMGKIDFSGGGTVAAYVAEKGIETVDFGTPLLSMHSPFEISSVADVYETYKAFKAILERKK